METYFVADSKKVFINTKASSYIRSSPLAVLRAISDLWEKTCRKRVSSRMGPAEATVWGVKRSIMIVCEWTI